jgi:1,4-alpha-glucan branching enzyme
MLYLDYSREPGQWTPNVHGGRENLDAVQFVQELTSVVRLRVPGAAVIAEESTAWPGVTKDTTEGGLGFDLKWNMGWMHDSLGYVENDPVHRVYHHQQMTFSMAYAYSEKYVLPISHDEVVHGKGSLLRKMPGDRWQQLANLRAYLAYMWAHPGKQLLFMGTEFGQESEWAESRELDWWLLDHPEHVGVQKLVHDLNRIYKETPALYGADHDPAGFQWIDGGDAGRNLFSWVRRAPGAEDLVCVTNFAAVPHHGVRLGLPQAGTWEELLNTDAELYAGSGVGNLGAVEAVDGDWSGQPAHADITVPPLASVWFRRRA